MVHLLDVAANAWSWFEVSRQSTTSNSSIQSNTQVCSRYWLSILRPCIIKLSMISQF